MDYYLGAVLSSSCLKHYGILGMKWGVRRYQNEDGTLTEAGKARYAKVQAKEQARALERERQMNPYGHGRSVSAEQRNRKSRDKNKYGTKGVNRIEERIDQGKTYKQAVRPENLLRGVKTVGYLYFSDQIFNGGRGTAYAKYYARYGAAKAGAYAREAAKYYSAYRAGKRAAANVVKVAGDRVISKAGEVVIDQVWDAAQKTWVAV